MPADFPALSAFLRAYLHQDFPEVHGDARSAVRAFRSQASPEEWRATCAEWRAFLSLHHPDHFDRARSRLQDQLGCAWHPRRWHDLQRLFPKP